LADSLGRGRAADRESAIARLTLHGERALPTLLEVLRQGEGAARMDALAVIERHDGPGARAVVHASVGDLDLGVARRAIEACVHYPDPGTVALLRSRVRDGESALRLALVESLLALLEQGLVEAMDPLLERILHEGEDEAVRRAASGALRFLTARERAPFLERLRARPHDAAGQRLLERVLGGAPDDSATAAGGGKQAPSARPASGVGRQRREAIDRLVQQGGPAAMAALHELLERLPRANEKAAQATEVAEARGRIHRALAALGSRLALYDLRESLAVRPVPVPSLLLGAAQTVGDASLVSGLAALAVDDPTLHDACLAALTTIVSRERLRRTSAAVKALKPAHRAILDRLWARPPGKAGPKGGQRGTTSRKTR
jgi:hypothetical protein